MKKLFALALIIVLIVVIGCKQVKTDLRIDTEVDEHGCTIAEGFNWCESKQQCISSNEDCPGNNLENINYEEVDEQLAIEVGKEHAKQLPEFNLYNGRNLAVTNLTSVNCEGCWIVELIFYTDSPDGLGLDKTEVIVTLEDFLMTDFVSYRSSVDKISEEMCNLLGGMTADICSQDQKFYGMITETNKVCCY